MNNPEGSRPERTDQFRLEAAPDAPGLLTIVDNRTGRSVLATHNGTPVIVGMHTAQVMIDALNREVAP